MSDRPDTTARVLSELLRHPGRPDATVAARLHVHPSAVTRMRHAYGLDAHTNRAGSLRRRVPGGLLARVEEQLGVAIRDVAPLPPAGGYYRLPRADRDRPPLPRRAPAPPEEKANTEN
ncbi:MAG TPA: hypothetical protein VFA44_02860 [Gaiellaceae bacterium]|nr:hypothetical protein [Gaiellaceae bacterium]